MNPVPGPAAAGASPATDGLSSAEAARRLAADGPNALPGGHGRSLWRMALDTVREPMFGLLLGAGALYLVLGELAEGLTLFGFVLATLALTLFQEGRTERTIDALRDLTSPRALLLRDGRPQRLPGRDVVRGDLMLLAEGDRVPADARLVQGHGLQVDESLLTGEAVPVRKQPADATAPAQPPRPGGDDLPWLYAGTLVVQGQGRAQVTATGAASEIGRIGAALGALAPEASPLQRQTARLVRTLALLALALSAVLVLTLGLLHGQWLAALLAGIALAMAMLPEEYPVVLTVFPALGARRLAREGVLTRRLAAIETLGATTVLCTDKTGTLTENRMRVQRLVAGGPALGDEIDLADATGDTLPEAFHALVEHAILASAPEPFDPMEQAFHALGRRTLQGTEHLHQDWRLVQRYPLSPALRAMSHGWATMADAPADMPADAPRVATARTPAGHVVAAKGAPEAIVDLCHLDAGQAAQVAAATDRLAAQGLRVLAVARGRFDGTHWPAGEHDLDFDFVGLLGLADPVRASVPAAVAECRRAGIRVLMITGDYPATARAIAAQAGLPTAAAGSVLSGDELATLDDAALRARLAQASVCARIAPEQKLRIVQALQAGGAVVAMTGDGVNDAPALRAAHVGVAMGARGTDVAREAAALVLVDDDFAAIVRAMRSGRRIYDNLQKAMSYILAVHVPIAGMALLPALAGWPVLLSPMHIALLELIIDPACSLAFEGEPAEPDLMQRPPRDAQAPLFGGAMLVQALLQGLGVLAIVALAYALARPALGDDAGRAFAFVTLVVGNLALIVANRSQRSGLRATLRRPNPVLWSVAGGALALLLAVLYWPWAAGLLHFAPLAPAMLAAAAALGLGSLAWVQWLKHRVGAGRRGR